MTNDMIKTKIVPLLLAYLDVYATKAPQTWSPWSDWACCSSSYYGDTSRKRVSFNRTIDVDVEEVESSWCGPNWSSSSQSPTESVPLMEQCPSLPPVDFTTTTTTTAISTTTTLPTTVPETAPTITTQPGTDPITWNPVQDASTTIKPEINPDTYQYGQPAIVDTTLAPTVLPSTTITPAISQDPITSQITPPQGLIDGYELPPALAPEKVPAYTFPASVKSICITAGTTTAADSTVQTAVDTTIDQESSSISTTIGTDETTTSASVSSSDPNPDFPLRVSTSCSRPDSTTADSGIAITTTSGQSAFNESTIESTTENIIERIIESIMENTTNTINNSDTDPDVPLRVTTICIRPEAIIAESTIATTNLTTSFEESGDLNTTSTFMENTTFEETSSQESTIQETTGTILESTAWLTTEISTSESSTEQSTAESTIHEITDAGTTEMVSTPLETSPISTEPLETSTIVETGSYDTTTFSTITRIDRISVGTSLSEAATILESTTAMSTTPESISMSSLATVGTSNYGSMSSLSQASNIMLADSTSTASSTVNVAERVSTDSSTQRVHQFSSTTKITILETNSIKGSTIDTVIRSSPSMVSKHANFIAEQSNTANAKSTPAVLTNTFGPTSDNLPNAGLTSSQRLSSTTKFIGTSPESTAAEILMNSKSAIASSTKLSEPSQTEGSTSKEASMDSKPTTSIESVATSGPIHVASIAAFMAKSKTSSESVTESMMNDQFQKSSSNDALTNAQPIGSSSNAITMKQWPENPSSIQMTTASFKNSEAINPMTSHDQTSLSSKATVGILNLGTSELTISKSTAGLSPGKYPTDDEQSTMEIASSTSSPVNPGPSMQSTAGVSVQASEAAADHVTSQTTISMTFDPKPTSTGSLETIQNPLISSIGSVLDHNPTQTEISTVDPEDMSVGPETMSPIADQTSTEIEIISSISMDTSKAMTSMTMKSFERMTIIATTGMIISSRVVSSVALTQKAAVSQTAMTPDSTEAGHEFSATVSSIESQSSVSDFMPEKTAAEFDQLASTTIAEIMIQTDIASTTLASNQQESTVISRINELIPSHYSASAEFTSTMPSEIPAAENTGSSDQWIKLSAASRTESAAPVMTSKSLDTKISSGDIIMQISTADLAIQQETNSAIVAEFSASSKTIELSGTSEIQFTSTVAGTSSDQSINAGIESTNAMVSPNTKSVKAITSAHIPELSTQFPTTDMISDMDGNGDAVHRRSTESTLVNFSTNDTQENSTISSSTTATKNQQAISQAETGIVGITLMQTSDKITGIEISNEMSTSSASAGWTSSPGDSSTEESSTASSTGKTTIGTSDMSSNHDISSTANDVSENAIQKSQASVKTDIISQSYRTIDAPHATSRSSMQADSLSEQYHSTETVGSDAMDTGTRDSSDDDSIDVVVPSSTTGAAEAQEDVGNHLQTESTVHATEPDLDDAFGAGKNKPSQTESIDYGTTVIESSDDTAEGNSMRLQTDPNGYHATDLPGSTNSGLIPQGDGSTLGHGEIDALTKVFSTENNPVGSGRTTAENHDMISSTAISEANLPDVPITRSQAMITDLITAGDQQSIDHSTMPSIAPVLNSEQANTPKIDSVLTSTHDESGGNGNMRILSSTLSLAHDEAVTLSSVYGSPEMTRSTCSDCGNGQSIAASTQSISAIVAVSDQPTEANAIVRSHPDPVSAMSTLAAQKQKSATDEPEMPRTAQSIAPAADLQSIKPIKSEIANANLTATNIIDLLDLDTISIDPISGVTTINEALTYLAGDLDEKTKEEMGYQIDDIVQTCTYAKKPCKLGLDFVKWNNPLMGNCFSFNHADSKAGYFARQAGMANGLRIQLKIGLDEYLPTVERTGYTIIVENREYAVFDGISRMGPAGHVVSLALSYTEMYRVGPPVGQCSDKPPPFYYYPGNYTLEGCLRSCSQKRLNETCGCFDPRQKVPKNGTICQLDQKLCVDQFTHAFERSGERCGCVSPCIEKHFENTMSIARLSRKACATDPNIVQCKNSKETFVLEVYFNKLSYFIMQETVTYTWANFFADLGGSVGLWLGACVIGCVEIIATGILALAHVIPKMIKKLKR